MEFFTSKDLKTWEFQSEFESRALVDCPELFQLPVDGDEKNKKWVLYGGPAYYYIGEFDGKKFTAESEVNKFNYGNAFYASQTFNNVPESDGRRVQVAWGTIPTPGMPFNMSLLFPVNLTLHKTDEGIKMFGYPVEEISKLSTKEYMWEDVDLEAGQNLLSDVQAELLDINVEFELDDAAEFGFRIKGKEIKYNSENQTISGDGVKTDLLPVDGKIRLRVLVDRLSIEIYANDGRIYMPVRAYPEEKPSQLEIFTDDDVTVNSLIVKELKSIWNK